MLPEVGVRRACGGCTHEDRRMAAGRVGSKSVGLRV